MDAEVWDNLSSSMDRYMKDKLQGKTSSENYLNKN